MKLSWNISQSNGQYTYVYSWSKLDGSALAGTPSHMLLEVSPTYTSANTLSTTPRRGDVTAPTTFDGASSGNSNPSLPGSLFGIKFDYEANSYTLVTDRAPIWGDLYSKNGRTGSAGSGNSRAFNAAWNSGFGTDPTASTSNFTNWVPTPDTVSSAVTIVPLPPAFWAGVALMVGTGIVSRRAAAARSSAE